jgi:hypothetical protein
VSEAPVFPLRPARLTESKRSLTFAVWETSDDVLPSDDRLLIGFLDMDGTDGRPSPGGGGWCGKPASWPLLGKACNGRQPAAY